MRGLLSRRSLLVGASAAGASLLAGCDQLAQQPWFRRTLQAGEDANLFVQRLMLSKDTLAREYSEADISLTTFRPNGTIDPDDQDYKTLAAQNFAPFRLNVGGLVEAPYELSLDELRRLPSRTQITRHDCVEGWSCIGKWTGVPLGQLIGKARLKPDARYVVFHCADTMETAMDGSAVRYYESVDLVDAVHPQTILAYDMNGAPLTVAHGAPIRLRVERQLGYKMAKYVMAIEAVASLEGLGQGNGGYWEDLGYAWYAGI